MSTPSVIPIPRLPAAQRPSCALESASRPDCEHPRWKLVHCGPGCTNSAPVARTSARVRENITLGVQAGYAHSVSGSSAEGYNGQATLNVTF
ncbi:hypothetical protein SK428_25940 [Escherichia coli]|nr:hypothetical protein [Escherichia coli]